MKGVDVLSRCPDATIVDLTHEVEPQNLVEGAFWLERSVRWFPRGTIFVAVVDPGVGTTRRGIVARAHDRTFIGPDNGLLAPALSGDASAEARAIDWRHLGLTEPSRTFHGRDVFAPVAADLASGKIQFEDVGPAIADHVSGDFPRVSHRTDAVEGIVVTIDRFGNLLTNIERDGISLLDPIVEIASLELSLQNTYADVGPEEFVAIGNSFGVIEIARRDGNAAVSLRLGRGASVVVRPRAARPS